MARGIVQSLVLATLLSPFATAAFAADAGTLSQESPDQWRASKLAGVAIYGPDDRNVGKITDVLMSKDGRAEYVIVGVGGFLGIGGKDVAIPYDQVVFSSEPVKAPPSTMGGSTPGTLAPAATNNAGGVPTASALGMGTTTAAGGAPVLDGAATTDPTMASGLRLGPSTAYPDHGRINMTADQLKSAPTFKFAS